MKLYYAPGACSLAPHIVAREAGIALDYERVDLGRSPHTTASGADYTKINPKGYVPALALEDGGVLTEGAAIMQYLADLAPESALAPPAGTAERYRMQEWLSFIASEVHKMFSPWLFHPEYGAPQAEAVARAKIGERFAFIDNQLAATPFLMGETFTAADAYCFTIVGWARLKGIALQPFPNLARYMDCVAARPRVAEAMAAEGLLAPAA